jgi:hypothetical protein
VGIGVGRQRELALADDAGDLGPGAALPMEERDPPVAEVMRRETRDAGSNFEDPALFSPYGVQLRLARHSLSIRRSGDLVRVRARTRDRRRYGM